jgi:D-glycero-alpha-D-manno-heptose 1-phosphate guanylyltransferase
MIEEAIILAGGLGTRLRSVIKDIPKPMAEISGKPFLAYLIDFLGKQKIKRVILSVGYKFEVIKDFFGNKYKDIDIYYAIEETPLGTGGAIKNALSGIYGNEVFIINGDTFFDIDLKDFYNLHKSKNSKLSIALKYMNFTDRYGTVEIDENNKILAFHEKTQKYNALINGGVYLLNKFFFNSLTTQNRFSFEKDFLEKYYKNYEFYGFSFDKYFIDIGVPEDYNKAQKELKNYF